MLVVGLVVPIRGPTEAGRRSGAYMDVFIASQE